MSPRSNQSRTASFTGPRTRHLALLVVASVMLAPLLVNPTVAQYQHAQESNERISSRTLNLIVPAVGELRDGTLVGVTMTMQATVRDGTGGVFVDTRPLTQVDMQGSARLAAATAAALAGEDAREYDFFMTIRSDTTAVGGPSAGAAMAIAFTALLLDLPLREDVVITGMINPDGSIGPVGGILQKAEAAHLAGATLFLIPQGQGVVEQVQREVTDDGWFPTVEEHVERINVSEFAEAQWGLEVREVTDVYEAFEWATDYRIERPGVPEVDPSPTFVRIMGEASGTQLRDADAAYQDVFDRLNATDLAAESPTTYESLGLLLERARERLDTAATNHDAGNHYSASSLVFQANLEIREVMIWLDALEAPDAAVFVTEYGEALAERLETTSRRAADADARKAATLEAVGAAQVRVLEAQRLLAAAQVAHGENRPADAIDALAFAEERRRSVEWWLGLADDIRRETSGDALGTSIGELSASFRGIAQEALAYAEVLIGQTGGGQDQGRILREAAANLADAYTAAEEDLEVGALYLAIEARVGAHAALSLVGSADIVNHRLDRQRDLALIAVDAARQAGAEPFLAVSYLDFARTLSTDQPVEALLMYGNAAAIAATSAALASGEDCGFAGVPCRSTTPDVSRIRVPGPDPWTAYFALATVLLGFMAGILVALVGTSARRGDADRHREAGAPPAMPPGDDEAPARRPRRAGPARHVILAPRSGHLRVRVPHPSPAAPGSGAAPRRARHVATSRAK